MSAGRPGIRKDISDTGWSGAGAGDIGKMTVTACIARLIVVVAGDIRLCAATAHSRRQPT